MKVNTHPIHPAMVEGAGGNGGGESWETEVGLEARGIIEVEVEEAIRLRARDGARPAIEQDLASSALFPSRSTT